MSNRNLDSLSRERKKNQLRQQMLSTQNHAQNRSPVIRPDARHDGSSEDSEEIVKKARRTVRRRRFTVFFVLAVVIAGAVFGFNQYQRNYQFSEYRVSWEIDLDENDYSQFEYFGDNVIKYNNNGASYYDLQGNRIWAQAYEMKAPIIASQGDYAAIADQRGLAIYIFHKDGTYGVASTVLPITKVAVSGTGMVAAIHEDRTAAYVNFYNRDGSPFKVNIKTAMGGNGYPLDFALSRDATQIISSYVYLDNGEMKNRVVFYDFSEVGKDIPTRLVAGFDDEFADTLATRVDYLTEPYSCAFAIDGLAFFSSRNLASPELIKKIPIDEEIRSVFHNKEHVGVIVRTGNGENPNRVDIYSKSGELVMSREFNYDYLYADIDGDLVLLYNGDSCQVYNLSGVLKLEAEFDFTVTKIRKGRLPNTLVVTGPHSMKEIKMQ